MAGQEDLRVLEECYPDIFRSEEVRKNLAQVFKHVRIMVVGRSGSGKSTLIRLVIGERGPRSMRSGTVGNQDINVEWAHPDPDLPLVFHDSNGIDTSGRSRVEEIRAFLDSHQRNADHRQRIHLVWYVVSAADNRLADDGGLLRMLDTRHPNLPLLLVMTFNDYGEKVVVRNIDSPDSAFDMLLTCISDPSKRQRARDTMVRLGNRVEQMHDGSIEGEQDVEGLKSLTQRTRELMPGEEFYATWIAAQVSDIDAKLDESINCIIKLKRYYL
jgi:energy-coupling factor transporter ATP-binding protein EcfA2